MGSPFSLPLFNVHWGWWGGLGGSKGKPPVTYLFAFSFQLCAPLCPTLLLVSLPWSKPLQSSPTTCFVNKPLPIKKEKTIARQGACLPASHNPTHPQPHPLPHGWVVVVVVLVVVGVAVLGGSVGLLRVLPPFSSRSPSPELLSPPSPPVSAPRASPLAVFGCSVTQWG